MKLYSVCAVVTVMTLCIHWPVLANEKSETIIADIKFQFNAGNYAECIELCKAALEKADNSEWGELIQETIGLSYFKLEQYEEAKRYTAGLLDQYPDSKRIGIWEWRLALIDEKMANSESALERYARYIENYPQGDYVLTSLKSINEIKKKLGEQPGNVSFYEKLIRDYPDNPKVEVAKVMLTEQLRKDGFYEEALEKSQDFIQEYDQSKHLALAYFGMANCYRNLRQTEKAREYFNYVVANYPDSQWAALAGNFLKRLNMPPKVWQKEPQQHSINQTIEMPMRYRTGIEIEWEATPEYKTDEGISKVKQLQAVRVLFTVKNTYAEAILIETGAVIDKNMPYKVQWEEGPGPYTITIDDKTGDPSRDTITARATILLFDVYRGESASSTFSFSEYLKTLQDEKD